MKKVNNYSGTSIGQQDLDQHSFISNLQTPNKPGS